MAEPILKEGARGAAVRTLTEQLVARGHLQKAGASFNRGVRRAVEEFQARHVDERGRPLVVDGVVGPLTWWALGHANNSAILEVGSPATTPAMPAGGSARGRAALQVALTEMAAGAREIGSNNSGAFVNKYLNGLTPPPANWCAGFVSWCYSRHAAGIPFRYSLGARDIRTQFRDKGWLYDPAEQRPQAGDIIVWWRGQPNGWYGHIGLVHHVSDGGILYTVEGNKGGFPAPVNMFNYVMGRIDRLLGFGRVP